MPDQKKITNAEGDTATRLPFAENARIFGEVEEQFDWCFIRTVQQMELQQYTVEGDAIHLSADPTARRADYFGKVLFDKRRGNSVFTPGIGPDFFHYCDGVDTNEEGGAIDGCGKLAVYAVTDEYGETTGYEFPVWKVVEMCDFRAGAAYSLQVNGQQVALEDGNGLLAPVAGTEVLVKGLTAERLEGYYLVPLILPERLVVYYATKDENTLLEWHKTVNAYKSHTRHWLICGFDTPLFRDDELSIFVTFNATLAWRPLPQAAHALN